MSVKGQRVSGLPDDVLSGLNYDPDEGSFWHSDPAYAVSVYQCRPRNRGAFSLLRVGPYEVEAHRIVFAILGEDISGQVVVHRNGDRCDNRFDNLLVLSKGEANRFRFQQRQAAKVLS